MPDTARPGKGQHTLPVIPDGMYTVDPAQTRVSFRAKAFGLIWVRGRLPVDRGKLRVQNGQLHATGSLAASRIDTGLAARDWHLRTSHYLHTRANAHIGVSVAGEASSGMLDGEVVVRGQPGRLELTLRSINVTEDGPLRIEANGTLDRTPFRMLPPLAGAGRRVHVDVTLVAERGPVS